MTAQSTEEAALRTELARLFSKHADDGYIQGNICECEAGDFLHNGMGTHDEWCHAGHLADITLPIIAERCDQAQAALLREIESEMLSRISARMVSNDYMDLMFALRRRAEAFEQRSRDAKDGA